MRLLVIAALLFATSAFAKDINVNDQEQIALQTICDVASVSTNVGRDVRAQIANFCVAWEKRVAAAKEPAADANANPAKPAEPAKPEKK